jgi:murein DD-endopeptidase MepM/ murein hydrolase activator NlpD
MAQQGTVNTQMLRLRSTPDQSDNANVINRLSQGTALDILEDLNNGWLRVHVPSTNQDGYLSKQYVLITATGPTQPASTPASAPTIPAAPSAPTPAVASTPATDAQPPTPVSAPVATVITTETKTVTVTIGPSDSTGAPAPATQPTTDSAPAPTPAPTPTSQPSVDDSVGPQPSPVPTPGPATPTAPAGPMPTLSPQPIGTPAGVDLAGYISTFIDEVSIPPEYDAFWAMQDTLGLPDPFDCLPIQLKSEADMKGMLVNGFGPNSFAYYNWPNYYSKVNGMHNGYDFIVPLGRPLLAVADGVIISTSRWPFMGDPAEKTVILWPFLPERFKDEFGGRMMSNVLVAYAHLSNNGVRKNLEVVKAGDTIGISGRPVGESSNDHLHMEIHLLGGSPNLFRNLDRKLLTYYKNPQPFDNRTPWNPILFYTQRLIAYQVHQLKTLGYRKGPGYPDRNLLLKANAGQLPDLNEFSLACYQYGYKTVWKNSGQPWPPGVLPLSGLTEALKTFTPFQPYPASSFLKT